MDSSEAAAAAGAGSNVKTWIPGTKSKGKKRPSHIPRVATGKREEIEVTQLQKRVEKEAPPVGSQEATAEAFADLPLSKYTQKGASNARCAFMSKFSMHYAGLFSSGFKKMTEIQRVAIPHGLVG